MSDQSKVGVKAAPGGLGRGLFLVTLGAIAFAIVSTPLASATSSSAPYKGTVQSQFETLRGGCNTLSTPTKGAFSLKTGIFAYVAKASAHGCAKPAGPVEVSYANSETLVNGVIALTIPSGSNSVAVDWQAAWSFSGGETHANGLACPTVTSTYSWGNLTYGSCDAGAQADFRAVSSIFDASTNTSIPMTGGGIGAYELNLTDASNYTYWYCYSGGSCSSSNSTYNSSSPSFAWTGSVSNTLYANATFVSGDHYFLDFQVLGAIIADCEGWTHCSASASLNLSPASGYGITLKSIMVT